MWGKQFCVTSMHVVNGVLECMLFISRRMTVLILTRNTINMASPLWQFVVISERCNLKWYCNSFHCLPTILNLIEISYMFWKIKYRDGQIFLHITCCLFLCQVYNIWKCTTYDVIFIQFSIRVVRYLIQLSPVTFHLTVDNFIYQPTGMQQQYQHSR